MSRLLSLYTGAVPHISFRFVNHSSVEDDSGLILGVDSLGLQVFAGNLTTAL